MSKKLVTIAKNAVTARLIDAERDVKLAVQAILTYQVAGSENTDAFKTGSWNGKSSFLGFRDGTFPAGFVTYVSANLRRQGFEVRIVAKPLPAPLGPEKVVVDSLPEDPRYEFQGQVVDSLVKHGQIIAQVATGGGKSRIARMCFARINRRTLFLTTRSILMHQMRDSFEKDLGVSTGVFGDGDWDVKVTTGEDGIARRSTKKMNVATIQSFLRRLVEPNTDDGVEAHNKQARIRAETISLLESFEFVIIEEAHEASGNSFYEILRHCKNAFYRIALTATPFMKDNQESNMRLMACSGPIAIKVTEKQLIDCGILAKPYFKFIQLAEKPKNLNRATPWQAAYRIGIVDNELRNAAIVRECRRGAKLNMKIMLLIQQTRHGEVLEKLLNDAGVRTDYIKGADDQKERQAALKRLKEGKIDVLIGSTILDVGVDVPAVGMIGLCGGGKAEVALRQRIGRGLREKKKGPNVALIFDFADDYNTHLKGHAAQRQQIIKTTEGFMENVIPTGQDFDFIGLGLARKAA